MGGFKAFLTKSNALALAIGVIIGASLGAVVTTLVNAIIMPPIGWGLFINSVIVFIVVMLVVYIIAKMFIKDEPPPGPTAEETLLTEIRDELRKRPA